MIRHKYTYIIQNLRMAAFHTVVLRELQAVYIVRFVFE